MLSKKIGQDWPRLVGTKLKNNGNQQLTKLVVAIFSSGLLVDEKMAQGDSAESNSLEKVMWQKRKKNIEETCFVVYAKQSDFHTFQPPKKLGKWILVVCGLLLGLLQSRCHWYRFRLRLTHGLVLRRRFSQAWDNVVTETVWHCLQVIVNLIHVGSNERGKGTNNNLAFPAFTGYFMLLHVASLVEGKHGQRTKWSSCTECGPQIFASTSFQ